MTIKQLYLLRTYLLSALFICAGTSQSDCYPESINERKAKWKAELLENIPELGKPEHAAVLTFFCKRNALHVSRHLSIATKDLAIGAKKEFSEHINPADRALLKELPRRMYELLIVHQAHNNRLQRKEPESLESFAAYWHLLNDTFVSYRDILTIIDSQPIQSFYGPDQDLENFCKLLDTYLKTAEAYDDWCRARRYARLSIWQKLNQWFLDSFM